MENSGIKMEKNGFLIEWFSKTLTGAVFIIWIFLVSSLNKLFAREISKHFQVSNIFNDNYEHMKAHNRMQQTQAGSSVVGHSYFIMPP